MAEIANPQLKAFCNEVLRPLANRLATIDSMLVAQQAEYNAKGLGTIITAAGPANLIDDGSAIDGRTRAAGGDVFNLVTLMTDLQAFITQGRRDVIAKWASRS